MAFILSKQIKRYIIMLTCSCLILTVCFLTKSIDMFDYLYYLLLTIFFLAPVLFKISHNSNYKAKIRALPVRRHLIFYSLAFSLTLFLFKMLLITALGYDNPEHIKEQSICHYIYVILFGGILGPIIEEFIFRGFLLSWLQRFGKQFAIIITAIVFGVLHGKDIIPHIAAGIMYASFAFHFNSIIPGIILHAGKNILGYILLQSNIIFIISGNLLLSLDGNLTFLLIALFFSLLLMIFIVLRMIKYPPSDKDLHSIDAIREDIASDSIHR